MTLPQEFPRDLVLLEPADVLPSLPEPARSACQAVFEAVRRDPAGMKGAIFVGPGGLRPLMAMMRIVVLGLRETNLERFTSAPGSQPLRSAYIKGVNVTLPLPERADVLFVERADQVLPAVARALAETRQPLYATWEGPASGPAWSELTSSLAIVRI